MLVLAAYVGRKYQLRPPFRIIDKLRDFSRSQNGRISALHSPYHNGLILYYLEEALRLDSISVEVGGSIYSES